MKADHEVSPRTLRRRRKARGEPHGNLGRKRPDLADRNRDGHSDETKEKIAEARRGTTSSDETKELISIAGLGRVPTKETKMKQSKSARESWRSRNGPLPGVLDNVQDESLRSKIRSWLRRGYWEEEILAHLTALARGVCENCGKPETATSRHTGKVRILCLDHHHDTGRYRSTLCSDCNLAVGLLGDTRAAVERTAKFIASRSPF